MMGLMLDKPSKFQLNMVEYIESNIKNIKVPRIDDPII